MKDFDTSNGDHYKNVYITKEDVGQPLDPAFIALKYPRLTPMLFTVLKKILRFGSSIKSKEQDIEDCMGALKREKQLMKLKHND